MKKIALVTIAVMTMVFAAEAQQQFTFSTITGPVNVQNGSPVTQALNDAANTENVPSGQYALFTVTADWVDDFDAWSEEAGLDITTAAGTVSFTTPTTGGTDNGNATTITFSGSFPSDYDPSVDGTMSIDLIQSYNPSAADWSNIEVFIEEAPTCPDPSALDATNITDTSADLEWMENGTATMWDIELGPGGFTPTGTPTDAGVTSNPYPVTNLTAETEYDFYVRADCGGGDLSAWIGPYTFETPCAAVIAPWSEDFENAGAIPDCWEQGASNQKDWEFADTTGSNHIGNNGTLTGSTASGDYFAWVDDSSPHELGTTLLSPYIDVSGLTIPALSFYFTSHNEGESNVDFSVDVWDGSAWNNVHFSDSNSDNGSGAWEKVVISLSSLTITGDIQIRFVIDENNGTDFYDDVAIDDVEVKEGPSCFDPSQLGVTNITATTADLEWTENGTATIWDIEHGPEGYTPTGTPTEAGVTTNPYTLINLNDLTEYDFYVRADCGGGDLSNWSGPFTFKTECAAPLSGTYTIDVTGDYTTLAEAVDALDNCGVSGAVTFNVIPGSGPYNEQVVIPEITGVSATNTITFNGNGETVTASASSGDRSLFLLDGADYVTLVDFDLVTQSATNNFVIQLTNDADHNSIINNVIDMSSTLTSSSSTNAGIVVSGSLTSATSTSGDSGTDNTIVGNTIIGGYYGISIAAASANNTYNNIISGNTVEDFYSYGISLRNNINSVVSGNEISRPARETVSSFYGVYLAAGGDGNAISANYIHTPFGGITSTTTSANYGIYHTAQDATAGNESMVVNNIIHLTGNNGSIYALYNNSSDGVYYYHNTVIMDDASATAGLTRGFYQTTLADDIELKNNIFSITRGGTGAKYCLYFNTSTSTITSDHNVLHMDAPAGTTGIGYSGGNQATLANWQTATSGDTNSVDGDPLFADIINGDYSPANASVDDIGIPVGVTTDINGDPRDATTPDAGAIEFDPPSCVQPSGLNAINITDTDADLEWTENGTATTWDIEWGVAGFTPTGTPTDAGVMSNPFPLTGLTAETEYDFYVRADCGSSDFSNWSGPYTFMTACAAKTTPWLDDVESHSTSTSWTESECWTTASASALAWHIGTGTTPSSNTGPSGAYSGNNYFFLEATGGSTGDEAELYTPSVDISGLTAPALSFYYHMYGVNMGDLEIDVYDGTNWNNNESSILGEQQTSDSDPWIQHFVDLSSYSGVIQIRFRGSKGNDFEGDISLDDIAIDEGPTCFDPSGLTTTNVADTSADLEWVENGAATTWDIELGLGGFTPTGTPTDAGVTSNPYPATGLTAETEYDFYVRADCGTDGTSSWAGPYTFETTCAAVTAPWSEDFENAGAIPDCWTQGANNNKDWEFANAPGGNHIGNNGTMSGATDSGGYFAWVDDSSPHELGTTLESPFIDVSGLTVPLLTFYYISHDEGQSNVDFSVDVWDGSAWNNVHFSDSNSDNGSGAWEKVEISLGSLTITGDIQVRFVIDENNGTDFYDDVAIDDVEVKEAPTCPDPSDLDVANITVDSADLEWTENGTATTWEIEYDPAGFTQGTGTVITGVTSNPYPLTGLTHDTEYEFYVRAECGTADFSDWIGPMSFKTLFDCTTLTLDITATTDDTVCSGNSATLTATATGNGDDIYWYENQTGGDPVGTGTTFQTDLLTQTTSYWASEVYGDAPLSGQGKVTNTANAAYAPSGTNDFGLVFTATSGFTIAEVEVLSAGAGGSLTVELREDDNQGVVLASATVSVVGGGSATSPVTSPLTLNFQVPGSGTYYICGFNGPSMIRDTGATNNNFPYPLGTVGEITSGHTWNNSYPETYYFFYNWTIGSGVLCESDREEAIATVGAEPPSGVTIDDVTETTADFSWTASSTDDGGYNWVVMASGDDPDTDPPVDNGSTASGVTTATATGLTHNTSYDAYVQSDCGGGDVSTWEGPVPFTTEEACEEPSDLVLSNITDTSVDISWTVPGDVSNVEGYGWRVMLQGDDPEVDPPVGEDFVTGATSTNTTITGLDAETDYDIYLVTVCDLANEFFSSPLMDTFTTEASCAEPTNVAANNITTTSVEFSWDASPDETGGYNWAVMDSISHPDTGVPVADGTVATGVTQKTVNGLEADVSYRFYVQTICGIESEWEGPLNFRTEQEVGIDGQTIPGFSFYPNPGTDVVFLKADMPIESVEVFSLTGQKVLERTVENDRAEIDVSGWASGPYLLKVTSGGHTGTYRLIKK